MLGLYIHIPFCLKKCAYCDFVSLEGLDRSEAYLRALFAEIETVSPQYPQKVDTVFIGGGTPGLLPEGKIAALAGTLKKHFDIQPDAEITIETNPCAVTPEKLSEYQASGVNRISMGLQAAQDRLLRLLGRKHTVEQFDRAFQLARTAGFDNINIDAIYAVPTQTTDDWRETLEYIMKMNPEHISAYALKLESGTPLADAVTRGEYSAIEEDADADFYEMAEQLLAAAEYEHYEISNFAREGRECGHNLKYWRLRDYLGLGAASHSCVGSLRFANTADVGEYVGQLEEGRHHYASTQIISEVERKYEYTMLKLRLAEGISAYEYRRMFGEDFFKRFDDEIKKAVACGLLEVEGHRARPTERGFALQNALVGIMTVNLA